MNERTGRMEEMKGREIQKRDRKENKYTVSLIERDRYKEIDFIIEGNISPPSLKTRSVAGDE